jgi:putative DNA primase/helicase
MSASTIDPPTVVSPPDLATDLQRRLDAAAAEGLDANIRRFLAFRGTDPEEWIEFQTLEPSASNCVQAKDAVRELQNGDKRRANGQYLVVNKLKPGVEARRPPNDWHVLHSGESTTCDSDILSRTLLYVDIDAERVKGISATNEEIVPAHNTAATLYGELCEEFGSDSVAIGSSGNGRAVFVALDHPPADEETKQVIAGISACIRYLHEKSGVVKFDHQVFDAKRIVPAFGTMKRKGTTHFKERPHRRTAIVAPVAPVRVGMDALRRYLDRLLPKITEPKQINEIGRLMGRKPAQAASAPAGHSAPPAPDDAFRAANAVPVARVAEWLGLSNGDRPICPGCGLTGDSSVAYVGNGIKCSHARCAFLGVAGRPGFRSVVDIVMENRRCTPREALIELAAEFGDQYGFSADRPRPVHQPPPPPPPPARRARVTPIRPGITIPDPQPPTDPDPDDPDLERAAIQQEPPSGTAECTDLANAERLARFHGSDLRFCDPMGGWLVWNGRHWAVDKHAAERLAQDAARQAFLEATANYENSDEAKARLKWAVSSQNATRLKAVLETARCHAGIATQHHQWDADPFLFVCGNGTIDLRTGTIRASSREDHQTKATSVPYDPAATYPLWDSFLEQATAGDTAMMTFLQRAVGYSLTSDCREEVFFLVHGIGGSGKSTFIKAIQVVLGDYSKTAAFDSFVKQKGQTPRTGPRDDIARLAGARMITAIEVDKDVAFSEGTMTSITGGDKIQARHLYKEAFEFTFSGKLWLACNYAPKGDDSSTAMKRRMRIIPFNHKPATPDPRVKELVSSPDAARAILAWAVRGCLDWQAHGLGVPPSVEAATSHYFADQNPLKGFLEECIEVTNEPHHDESREAVRARYESWARAQGVRFTLGAKEFTGRMRALASELPEQYREKIINGRRLWVGIRLRDSYAPNNVCGE